MRMYQKCISTDAKVVGVRSVGKGCDCSHADYGALMLSETQR